MANATDKDVTALDFLHVCKVLGDGNRFQLFRYLTTYTELCGNEAAALLAISTAATCQHFKRMEDAGVVIRRRSGRRVCYRLNTRSAHVRLMRRAIAV